MYLREDNQTNDEIHQVRLHCLYQQEHPNHHQIYEPKKLELQQMLVAPNQLLLRIVILFWVHLVQSLNDKMLENKFLTDICTLYSLIEAIFETHTAKKRVFPGSSLEKRAQR